MTLFLFYNILAIGAVIIGWYLYCRFRLKDNTLDVILENKTTFIKTIILAILIVAILCWRGLYKTVDCSMKSVIMKTDTQYSWLMDECQARNAAGSYIDINRTRGNPADNDHIID